MINAILRRMSMNVILPVKIIITARCMAYNWQEQWLNIHSPSDVIKPESTNPYHIRLFFRKLSLRNFPSCGKSSLKWNPFISKFLNKRRSRCL